MPGIARVSDRTIGVCFHPSHAPAIPFPSGGVIITGSGDVITNNLPTARVGDLIRSDCGHQSVIVSGSGKVLTNSRPTARMGDSGAGVYMCTIIGGSGNVIAS